MKKLLFIIILGLLISKVHAQDITLKWADKIKTKGRVSIIGGKNNKYYTVHKNKDQNLIARTYNEAMVLENEKAINFKLSDKKRFGYKGAFFVDQKIMHFIYEKKKKQKKEYIYAGLTDGDLKTEDKLYVLDEYASKKSNHYIGSRSLSPDSTKVLMYHEKSGKRREPNTLVYKVYNSDVTKVISEGAKKLPIKSKNFSSDEIEVDNFGNVYVLAKVWRDGKRKKGQSKYFYKVIIFGVDDSVTQYDFDYKDNNIASISMVSSENNTFVCTGFLNNLKGGKKKLISDEMFVATIDCKKNKLTSSIKYEVPGLYPEKMRKSAD